tara:strand:+ start:5251 stop:6489 length:1239 start_codon:yes stop_codon:yes gene_type:complete
MDIIVPDKIIPLFQTKKKYIPIWGGRASGKSWGVGDWIALKAYNGHRCLCFREIQTSIKESSFELVQSTIDRHKMTGFRVVDNEISHRSGGKIVFKGLKGGSLESEKTRIKSLENFTVGWGEEAGSITESHLDLLMPTFRKNGSQVVFTYNRLTGAEPVHNKFVDKVREDTELININYWDNPFLDEEARKEADALKETDYDLWLHIYGGEPAQDLDRAIISRKNVMQAVERNIKAEGAVEVGADIARFGSDRTVFVKRKGMKIIDIKEINKADLVQVSAELIRFTGSKSIPVKVDDGGLGGGVTDILKNSGQKTIPINFAGKPKDKDKYPNIASEMWFEVADIIDKMDIPDIRDMKEELSNRIYSYDTHGRRKVESKDDYKKRAGRSPDYADAVLLAYYTAKVFEYKELSWG